MAQTGFLPCVRSSASGTEFIDFDQAVATAAISAFENRRVAPPISRCVPSDENRQRIIARAGRPKSDGQLARRDRDRDEDVIGAIYYFLAQGGSLSFELVALNRLLPN